MLLSKIVFIVLSATSGAFLGLLIARFFISKEQGFGALTAELAYGIIGLVLAIVASFFLMNKLLDHQIFVSNIMLAVFSLGVMIWIVIQVQKNRRNNDGNDSPPPPR